MIFVDGMTEQQKMSKFWRNCVSPNAKVALRMASVVGNKRRGSTW